MALIHTQLKALTPGDHKDEQGLVLRVSKSGDIRTWSLFYPFGTKRRKMKIGSFPAMSLMQARAKRDELRGMLAQGIDPMGEIETAEKSKVSVAVAVQEFLASHGKKLKPTSLENYTFYLEHRLVPMFGDVLVTELTRHHVAEFIATYDDKPAAAAAAFKVVRRFLRWCNRTAAYIETNPAYSLDAPTDVAARERVLAPKEIRDILGAVRGRSDAYALLAQLLMLTACRLNEIRTLRWSDVDLEEGSLTILNTKNGKDHTVYLSTQALRLLRTVPRRNEYIISANMGKSPFAAIANAKKQMALRSGVSGWRNHDLRRTAATIMQDLDVDRYVIKAVLNHSIGDVTAIYARSELKNQKRAALQKLADRYDEIAGASKPVSLAMVG